ncbi:probable G-protein coupled receptor 150 [Alligator mississippiensis]|uniref:probable G-protein coupled receptor 150 n=1 Tax=Alligator mississippiensis TaxID=8496 RepID=UPI00287802E7|nr:probable G-protein coupled receptor 150 [Alligator mississippiensis]
MLAPRAPEGREAGLWRWGGSRRWVEKFQARSLRCVCVRTAHPPAGPGGGRAPPYAAGKRRPSSRFPTKLAGPGAAMEEPFSPEPPPAASNLSSGIVSAPGGRWAPPSEQARVAAAAAVLLLAVAGNGLVLHRLRGCCGSGRRRRRKMDFLIAHLALADLYGCGLSLLAPELLAAAPWPAGDAACRLLRLLQGSGPAASAHVLVLLALERQHVVSRPARPPLPSRALAALGWGLALLLALPHAFAFGLAAAPGGARCLCTLERPPRWPARLFAAYGAVSGFLAPAALLAWAYGRIVLAAGQQQRPGPELGPPAPMPRARVKTLQLTLVLMALFALCRLPRCLLQLGRALGAARGGPPATLRIVAAANSALNPFAYLLFQSQRPWARRLQRSLCPAAPAPPCCRRCCLRLDGPARRRAPHRPRPRPPPQPQPAGDSGL